MVTVIQTESREGAAGGGAGYGELVFTGEFQFGKVCKSSGNGWWGWFYSVNVLNATEKWLQWYLLCVFCHNKKTLVSPGVTSAMQVSGQALQAGDGA